MTDTMSDTNVDELVANFPGMEPIVRMYVQNVEKVNQLDEEMGLSSQGSSFWAGLKDQNPHAVTQAQEIIAQVNAIDNAVVRAIVSQMLRTERSFLNTSEAFSKEHAPKEEAPKVDTNKLAELYAARSDAQKMAAGLYSTIEIMFPEEIKLLPERPQGRKGGAPGARGAVGRKLPVKSEYITWNINGEEFTGKSTADIAKAAGLKGAKELRTLLEQKFPESLPNNFSFETEKGVEVAGNWHFKNSNNAPAPEEEDTDVEADEDE